MNIKHEIVNFDGVDKLYIYVEVADEYEFGEEFLHSEDNKGFLHKLKDYVNQKVEFKKDDMAVLIINGVLIGAISLGLLTNVNQNQITENAQLANQQNQEISLDVANKNKLKEVDLNKSNIVPEASKVDAAQVVTPPQEVNIPAPTPIAPVKTATVSAPPTTTVVKTTSVAAPKPVAGTTIRLSTNGVVSTMNLEDYVIGVVASEMPVTFQPEALKAQAIEARTFAMKKTSQGSILVNSTSNQVYKSESQLKKLWGSSYTVNYNKIKNAVNATKGLVLTYNGKYIDCLLYTSPSPRDRQKSRMPSSA